MQLLVRKAGQAAAKAVGKAVSKSKMFAKKKPMASKATQEEYSAKLASRGKMTDAANKARMDKLSKPSPIKDVAKKKASKKPMATKK